MSQQDFYNLPEVTEQLIRQKAHPYNSPIHKLAHKKLCEIAQRNNVPYNSQY